MQTNTPVNLHVEVGVTTTPVSLTPCLDDTEIRLSSLGRRGRWLVGRSGSARQLEGILTPGNAIEFDLGGVDELVVGESEQVEALDRVLRGADGDLPLPEDLVAAGDVDAAGADGVDWWVTEHGGEICVAAVDGHATEL